MEELLTNNDQKSKEFLKNIRHYNSALAFASFNCEETQFASRGTTCFRINGQIYHRLNLAALHNKDKEDPQFAQYYLIDSAESAEQRMNIQQHRGTMDKNLLIFLDGIIRKINPFAKAFMMMKDVVEKETKKAEYKNQEIPEIRLLFNLKEGLSKQDKQIWNIPKHNEVIQNTLII